MTGGQWLGAAILLCLLLAGGALQAFAILAVSVVVSALAIVGVVLLVG